MHIDWKLEPEISNVTFCSDRYTEGPKIVIEKSVLKPRWRYFKPPMWKIFGWAYRYEKVKRIERTFHRPDRREGSLFSLEESLLHDELTKHMDTNVIYNPLAIINRTIPIAWTDVEL